MYSPAGARAKGYPQGDRAPLPRGLRGCHDRRMVREIPRSVTLITARPGLDIGEHAAAEARRQGVPPWVVPTYCGRRVLTVRWEWTERADRY